MKAMQTIDMRKLTREARHKRRVQVIRLRKAGRTYDKIAALTGLSRTGSFGICKRHAVSGSSALHDAVGGRKLGQQRLLIPAQESLVQNPIADKTPDQLKRPYALCSRAAVAKRIEQRLGLKLKVRTMEIMDLAAHMVKLEQSPERVKSFFQDPRVKYAA
jgi:hypothetical protein